MGRIQCVFNIVFCIVNDCDALLVDDGDCGEQKLRKICVVILGTTRKQHRPCDLGHR